MRKLFVLALAVFAVACGEDACEEAEMSCDGTLLLACEDGSWVEEQDCADDGMMCHEEMGHCMGETGM